MVTVKDLEVIRRSVFVEGLSQRQAAVKYKRSRKSIKAALAGVLIRNSSGKIIAHYTLV